MRALPGSVLLALCERSPKMRLGPGSARIVKVCSDFLVGIRYAASVARRRKFGTLSLVRSRACTGSELRQSDGIT